MIAGGSGDGQQVLVVVASVVEQEVARGLKKRQREVVVLVTVLSAVQE